MKLRKFDVSAYFAGIVCAIPFAMENMLIARTKPVKNFLMPIRSRTKPRTLDTTRTYTIN